jgi:hypothetical protein
MRYARTTGIVGTYARYTAIMQFIKDLENNNPDLVSSYSAGTTYEDRDLTVAVFKTSASKKAIWIDCGIHAVCK